MKFEFTKVETITTTYEIDDLTKEDFMDWLNGDEPTEEAFLEYLESEKYWAETDVYVESEGYKYDRDAVKDFLESCENE